MSFVRTKYLFELVVRLIFSCIEMKSSASEILYGSDTVPIPLFSVTSSPPSALTVVDEIAPPSCETVVEGLTAEVEAAVVEPEVPNSLTANDEAIPVEDSNTATLSNVTATLSNLLLIIIKPPLLSPMLTPRL